MAAVFDQRDLGSVRERFLGFVSARLGIRLGIAVPVGLDSVPLWPWQYCPSSGLGMAAVWNRHFGFTTGLVSDIDSLWLPAIPKAST